MANELIYLTASTINGVVSAAASIAASAFNATAAVASVVNADTHDYRFLKMELRMTFNGTGSIVPGAVVSAYFRRTGVGGTKAPQPDTSYKHDFAGNFRVDPSDASGEQVLTLEDVANPIDEDFDIWIQNKTGRACAPGWDLDIVPYTYQLQS